MTEHNEVSVAHMSMIQGIITRLETNCFTLKALAMTLAVALLALVGSIKNASWVYPLAGCLPVCVFWIVDAQYLRLGRCFRRLFDAVRKREVNEPFNMDIGPYMRAEQSTIRIAFSWSVSWYYASVLAVFLFVTIYFLCITKEATNGEKVLLQLPLHTR
jgi:hypothetical protein